MIYYIAIMKDAIVHFSDNNLPVKIDLKHEEVIDIYSKLENVLLFENPNHAAKYAIQTQKSDNFYTQEIKTTPILGKNVRKKRVPIIYQVQELKTEKREETSIKISDAQKCDEMVPAYAYAQENIKKLELMRAYVGGLSIYNTEKYAKIWGKPLIEKHQDDNEQPKSCFTRIKSYFKN